MPSGATPSTIATGAAAGQGASVEELLAAFDEVGEKHEKMGADKFNDDGTYKAGINQVGVACE